MGRTPLISFWSISHSHSFPEIIPPLCLFLFLSRYLSSLLLRSPKYTKTPASTLKTLLERTNNGNVLLDSLRFTFRVSALGVE